jgi:cell division protein FtsN
MAKDYANEQRRKRESRGRPRQRQSAFHLGSFGAGLALGIAFTLAGALLPGWWSTGAVTAQKSEVQSRAAAPVTQFEFFDRLPNEKLAPGAAQNGDRTPIPPPTEPREFLLQAGSFTNAADAERLRATLLQMGLNSETAAVTLSSGAVRHRVIVGPFASTQDTQRAMTQLRDQDIEALVLARKPAAG